MGDIKFRAWDKERIVFGEVYSLTRIEQTPLMLIKYENTDMAEARLKDGMIIEQYTPVKNICQGDIVYIAGVGNCTIIFDGLTFEVETPKGDIVELRDCLEDIEKVVGNIHEP